MQCDEESVDIQGNFIDPPTDAAHGHGQHGEIMRFVTSTLLLSSLWLEALLKLPYILGSTYISHCYCDLFG